MCPQDPLIINSAANEIYSHLGSVRNTPHRSTQKNRSHHTSQKSLNQRRARSYTRVDCHKSMERHGSSRTSRDTYCLKDGCATPKGSTRGPLEPQSFSSSSNYQQHLRGYSNTGAAPFQKIKPQPAYANCFFPASVHPRPGKMPRGDSIS